MLDRIPMSTMIKDIQLDIFLSTNRWSDHTEKKGQPRNLGHHQFEKWDKNQKNRTLIIQSFFLEAIPFFFLLTFFL